MSECNIQPSKRFGGLQPKPTWFCSHGVWWDCDTTPTRCPVAAARAETAAQEREACARLAEELDGVGGGPIIPYSFTELAADIRARGEAPKPDARETCSRCGGSGDDPEHEGTCGLCYGQGHPLRAEPGLTEKKL